MAARGVKADIGEGVSEGAVAPVEGRRLARRD
jgi:hypothetical protein